MVTIIDGAMGTELAARGHDVTDRLWSARLLISDPEAIEAVHLAYFEAGAVVATTASYQATVPGFLAVGLDRSAALEAIRDSAVLARRARERFLDSTAGPVDGLLVAGSIGPFGAMLADGSEYTGDYDPGPAALREVHAPRIDALLEGGVDLLAIETIPTVREAEILLAMLDEFGAVGWLSFQCRDDRSTAAGEPIAEAVGLGRGVAGLVAIGVNCTAPRFVPTLLDGAATDLPLIAYPNGGDRWDAAQRRWIADDAGGGYDAAAVAGLAGHGAAWLGGCCGTRPADIKALAGALAA
jgi:homocysteine S-methyltransferase